MDAIAKQLDQLAHGRQPQRRRAGGSATSATTATSAVCRLSYLCPRDLFHLATSWPAWNWHSIVERQKAAQEGKLPPVGVPGHDPLTDVYIPFERPNPNPKIISPHPAPLAAPPHSSRARRSASGSDSTSAPRRSTSGFDSTLALRQFDSASAAVFFFGNPNPNPFPLAALPQSSRARRSAFDSASQSRLRLRLR
ncbi:hypothetical protein GUJ93_ZPchr0006g44694 [Zizania palustris]|uniref:Uncharacterized protein n=1 Tax=Zizania palustris TaxID=103762 RepID=A0A8J5TC90_ZIZPA|nr:hypothetical protein GUJ93_ZPchr0006g44694 [Zizania palustris]